MLAVAHGLNWSVFFYCKMNSYGEEAHLIPKNFGSGEEEVATAWRRVKVVWRITVTDIQCQTCKVVCSLDRNHINRRPKRQMGT